MIKIFFILFFILLSSAAVIFPQDAVIRKDKLSEYGFFEGSLPDLVPGNDLVPYEVNSSLFSNYADKKRFVKVPPGEIATYNDSVAFDFPVGTVLIKNFYFSKDARKPEGPRQLIETRLLVRQSRGWEAWPYIWNAEQTDAVYDPAGELKSITMIGIDGKTKTITHAIPNKNQCKGCHTRGGTLQPIGVSAKQLNREVKYGEGISNQLDYWAAHNMVKNLPESRLIPRLATWNDAASGTLAERARAYLDANCAHCHSRTGPASTSGLFLDHTEKDRTHLGIMKSPVAAGRGASNLSFDIVPGKPNESILLYRMRSTDPAVAMPEIGREEVHREGVALIEEWIRKSPL